MNNELFNKPLYKKYRQKLRTFGTKSEALLWNELKSKQLGHKFRRQHGIGRYIVDFYCPSKKLVIELDGGTHDDPIIVQRDEEKELFIKQNGFTVLRFTDNEIYDDINTVVEQIYVSLGQYEI